jgi:hypothetical protein
VKNRKIFVYLQPGKKINDLVAQPVEQLTLNQWVESSILSQVTEFQKPLPIALEAVFVFRLFSNTAFLHAKGTF